MDRPFGNNQGGLEKDSPKTIYKQAIAPYSGGAGGNTQIKPQNQAYTVTNNTPDRDLSDPATITATELGNVLGTLINDLKASGIIR